MLLADNDSSINYLSSRIDYMAVVGDVDLYQGLQSAAQVFVDYSMKRWVCTVASMGCARAVRLARCEARGMGRVACSKHHVQALVLGPGCRASRARKEIAHIVDQSNSHQSYDQSDVSCAY